MKFIFCVDSDLKLELISKGFVILKEDSNGATFALDNKLKFNFDNVDKSKYTFVNKLNF